MLHIYNSFHNKKQEFTSIVEGKINMYVCGMTVYDYCHLGHARVMIVFDIVYRYLQAIGYEVNYVRNITDIDDKIIQRANENNEDFNHLTKRFIDAMHNDEKALGILRPTQEPRATDHIENIISMIQTLIKKNYAYHASNNDVYYSIAAFKDYGKLSGRNLEDLRAGERIAIDQAKQHPLDFVLWKSSKPDEPAWDSPWGKGRPGWHIECSAMSMQHLGNNFDIHGGGHDLQFPHHENEIAQSEACTGEHYANYWMHNGFIRINEEKMSKSLNNFFTIRDVLKTHKAEAIRYFMLTSHYRSPLNYSTEQLDNANTALDRLYTALRDIPIAEPLTNSDYEARFHRAMKDDFNTPEALAVLFELVRESNRLQQRKNKATAAPTAALLKKLAQQLGLLESNPEDWFKTSSHTDTNELSDAVIDTLIEKRTTAKRNKQWQEADKIRSQLQQNGIILEDTADGSYWKRK